MSDRRVMYIREARVFEIARQVSGLGPGDLVSDNRTKKFVDARSGISLGLHWCGYSTPRIGRMLNRDHTSVLSMLRRSQEKPNDVSQRIAESIRAEAVPTEQIREPKIKAIIPEPAYELEALPEPEPVRESPKPDGSMVGGAIAAGTKLMGSGAVYRRLDGKLRFADPIDPHIRFIRGAR